MNGQFSLLSFIGGAALGLLLASAWFLSGPSAASTAVLPSSDDNASTSASLPAMAAQSGAVEVRMQAPGPSVTVASVTVSPPGVWIAVREVNAGALGNVLGAVKVGGPRADIAVPLLRATEPNRTYAVELYRDDGNGAFDVASDSVYVDFDTGERVVAYFSTTE